MVTFADDTKVPGWGPENPAWHTLAYMIDKEIIKSGTDKPKEVYSMLQIFQDRSLDSFHPNLNAMYKHYKKGKLDYNEKKIPTKIMKMLKKGGVGAKKKKSSLRSGRFSSGGNSDNESIGGLDSDLKDLGISDNEGSEAESDNSQASNKKKAAKKSPACKKRTSLRRGGVQTAFGSRVFRMKLPFVKYFWTDGQSRKHCTIIVHLPAGTFKKGCVTGRIINNRKVRLLYDWTHLALLDPASYKKAFFTQDVSAPGGKRLTYTNEHVHVVEHANKVRDMKGFSSRNKVMSSMTIDVGVDVENDFLMVHPYPGFLVMKVGKKNNPQIFAHMELMLKNDSHYVSQPGRIKDFTEDGDESESSEET